MVRRLLVLCILVLAVSWTVSLPVEGERAPQQASWTFMVYMAADNNLEGAGIDDFLEMAVAGSDPNLNIVVQFDRIPGYDGSYDNWTSTKRFRITPGMTPAAANALMDIGEANMGSPQTVIDFVNWARANYPADHYALIFWNHGGGWLSDLQPRPEGVTPEDFCWDDTDGGDAITSAELYQVLDSTTGGGVTPLDQVGFDACLMAMWEVDNQIKPFGSAVSVSSEELEPWDGWPYDTILTDLKANPDWAPAQLGYDIVQRYYESYGNSETQSAKDLGVAYTELNHAVDALAEALVVYEPTYHNQYNTARSAAQDFGSSFIDLYDFAAKIETYVAQPEVHAAADALMAAVDAALIHERHGPSWPGAHGIDLYFPLSLDNWTAYKALRSSDLTHWDEFVQYHATGTLPCAEAFIEDVSIGVSGLEVTLTATVQGDAPLDHVWSFGDGETSTEPSPVHTYAGAGSYLVTLQVTNCSGQGQSDWSDMLELVAGVIVQPPALLALLPPDDAATATLWITNSGAVDLSWTLSEIAVGKASGNAGPQLRPRSDPVIDPELAARLSSGGRAQVIVYLRELADLSPAYGMADKGARRQFVYDRLRATAMRSGGELVRWLHAAGAQPRQVLAVNAIAATLDARLAAEVAVRPEVAQITLDHDNSVLPVLAGQAGETPDTVEWNIAKIRADQAWSEFGITGQGVVIGEIDTGAMVNHLAIVSQYRGNLGGGTFDHNYNWFDFVNGQPVPYDDNGHGTMGLGVAAGDDGGTNQIGVAPGARWIAAKACTGGGSCSDYALLAAADWMLAPTRLDGSNPDPSQAPDMVLNMWGYSGVCDPWYDPVMQAWRAANILPIFTPGTGGPNCGSVASPGNSSQAFTAGATDATDVIAWFSGRGPSPCTGEIKPEVTAPGVNIRSSYNNGGYYVWEGSAALATAHLAGTAALVLSADPLLDIGTVETIIEESALCIEDLSCGGTPCPDGANNVYGWGRVDAYEAVSLTLDMADVLPWLDESPVAGTLTPGEGVAVDVTFDSAGLAEGVYAGWLDVTSDDPQTPHVMVPVTLTVEICHEVDILAVIYDNVGCQVTFSAQVTGTEPVSLIWDFGDGITSTLANPIHAYPGNGTYTATLEVSNCDGNGSDGWTGVVALVPEIGVDPPALEATLYPDEVNTATLWLANDGTVDLSFVLHETGTLGLAAVVPTGGETRPRAEPIVDPQLAAQVQAEGQARVLIYLRELPDLSPAYAIADKDERRQWVYDQLNETAMRSGDKLYTWLEAAGAGPRRLLAVNAIAARLDRRLLAALAVRSEVAYVSACRTYGTKVGLPGSPGPGTEVVEWNIAKIRADQAWSEFGITGQGAVVGEIDTGVMYDHPALVNQYRGNLGGGTFDHNYNWFDFVDGQPVPSDPNGHGTFGMGIAVGGDGGANQIGVAPGARWIAVKACGDGGSCSDLDLLAAAEWMLAPTRLDGTGADPSKAPDLVLNMWGGGGCDGWFEAMLQAWRAADILPVFAPGGSGPGCNSIGYPAASDSAVSAGATDQYDVIGPFSAHGPSPCTGSIKPEVAAPGINIRSSSSDGGYQVWSGTSMSAAHLAGISALVISAAPSLGIGDVQTIVQDAALCIEDLSCGGTPCPDGANNVYGWGRIDAYEAVSLTVGGLLFDLPWLSEAPTAGVISPGLTISVAVIFDAGGLEPGVYTGLLDVESDDPETPHVGVPVTLTVEPPPVCYEADILAVIYERAGCQVSFSAQVTGTEPISLTWDFGQHGTYTEPSPTVEFGVTGSYTGTLTVSNCDGVGNDVQPLDVDVECVTIRMIYIPLVVKDS